MTDGDQHPGNRLRTPRLIDRAEILRELLVAIDAPARIASALRLMGNAVDCRLGILVLKDGPRWVSVEYFPERHPLFENYVAGVSPIDPYRVRLDQLQIMRFHRRETILPFAEVEQSDEFRAYADWANTIGIRDTLVARLPISLGFECRLVLLRIEDEPPFKQAEADFLDTLLPPLREVLELWNRFDAASIAANVSNMHLGKIGHGVLSVDANGLVQYANRVAEDMLADNVDTVALTNGRFLINCPVAKERYHHLFTQCREFGGDGQLRPGGAMSVPRQGRSPLRITVHPFRRVASETRIIARAPCVTVTLFDPQRAAVDPRNTLSQMFGLSAAESDLCWRLANGDSLQNIAAAVGTSTETIRSQLKRVFAKTGTNRQSDVVRLVLTGPALHD